MRLEGGSDFFCVCKDLGKALTNHSLLALNLVFFFKREDQVVHTNSMLLGQDQSIVAQQAETTVDECSLVSCM